MFVNHTCECGYSTSFSDDIHDHFIYRCNHCKYTTAADIVTYISEDVCLTPTLDSIVHPHILDVLKNGTVESIVLHMTMLFREKNNHKYSMHMSYFIMKRENNIVRTFQTCGLIPVMFIISSIMAYGVTNNHPSISLRYLIKQHISNLANFYQLVDMISQFQITIPTEELAHFIAVNLYTYYRIGPDVPGYLNMFSGTVPSIITIFDIPRLVHMKKQLVLFNWEFGLKPGTSAYDHIIKTAQKIDYCRQLNMKIAKFSREDYLRYLTDNIPGTFPSEHMNIVAAQSYNSLNVSRSELLLRQPIHTEPLPNYDLLSDADTTANVFL